MLTRSRKLASAYITAEFGLSKIGDQIPYFSVTGSLWDTRAQAERKPDDPHTSGMIHDEILTAFPDLADLVALHLSDINGVPMHAMANSWYWAREGNPENAANLLRVPVQDLPPVSAGETTWGEFVEAQRPRWAAEAAAAIEKYDLSA